MGEWAGVKTTIEIPDPIFRKAKQAAAEEGRTLKDFVAEAVQDRVRQHSSKTHGRKRWEDLFGALRHLRAENRRIERLVEAEFETIDEKEWR